MSYRNLLLIICLFIGSNAALHNNWTIMEIHDNDVNKIESINDLKGYKRVKKVDLNTTYLFATLVNSKEQSEAVVKSSGLKVLSCAVEDVHTGVDKKGRYFLPIDTTPKVVLITAVVESSKPHLQLEAQDKRGALSIDADLTNAPKPEGTVNIIRNKKDENIFFTGSLEREASVTLGDLYLGDMAGDWEYLASGLSGDVNVTFKNFYGESTLLFEDKKLKVKQKKSSLDDGLHFSKEGKNVSTNDAEKEVKPLHKNIVKIESKSLAQQSLDADIETEYQIVSIADTYNQTVRGNFSEPTAWNLSLNNRIIDSGKGRSVESNISENIIAGVNTVEISYGGRVYKKRFFGLNSEKVDLELSQYVLFSDIDDSTHLVSPINSTSQTIIRVYDDSWNLVDIDTALSTPIYYKKRPNLFPGLYYIETIDSSLMKNYLSKVLIVPSTLFPKTDEYAKGVTFSVVSLGNGGFIINCLKNGVPFSDTVLAGEYESNGIYTLGENHLGIGKSFSVDLIPPVISITSPVTGSYTNKDSLLVEWSVDGIPYSSIEHLPLIGMNTIYRETLNDLNEVIQCSTIVYVDKTAPAVQITAPIDSLQSNVSPITVTWSVDGVLQTTEVTQGLVAGWNSVVRSFADVAGNIGSDTVSVFYDVTAPVVQITAPVDGFTTNTTPVAISWTVDGVAQTTDLSATLVVGENKIIRSATDAAGNSASDTISVFYDVTAPVVQITAPADGYATNVTPIAISWTVDGVAQTTDLSATLVVGENKIIRSTTDAAGNIASDTISVVYDVTAPGVQITAPVDGYITNANPIAISWTVDGVAQTTDLSAILVVGENKIIRSATDAAGNIASDTISVVYDNSIPLIENVTPLNNAVTLEKRPEISATLSDQISGIDANAISVLLNGVDISQACVFSNGILKYLPTVDLPIGSNSIAIGCRDKAGNESAISQTVFDIVSSLVVDAIDDSVEGLEDSDLVINTLLNNDIVPENDSIYLSWFSDGAHGVVTKTAENTLLYKPNTNFFGTDSIIYKVKSILGQSDTAIAYITVKPVNDKPEINLISSLENNSDTVFSNYPFFLKAYIGDYDDTSFTVTFYQNGTPLDVDKIWETQELGNKVFNYPLLLLNKGEYTYTSTVYDSKGDSAVSNVLTLVSKNTPPSLKLITELYDSLQIPETVKIKTPFTLKAYTADANGSVTKVDFYSGDVKLDPAKIWSEQEGTSVVYNYPISLSAIGNYTFKAIAYDNDGDSTISEIISMTGDNNLPDLSFTISVQDTAALWVPFTMKAFVGDMDGTVEDVTFYVDGVALDNSKSWKTIEDGQMVYNYSYQLSDNKLYSFKASAKDDQGGVTTSEEIVLTGKTSDDIIVSVTPRYGYVEEDDYGKWELLIGDVGVVRVYGEPFSWHQQQSSSNSISDATSGTVKIVSANTGFSSGEMPLYFESYDRSLYSFLPTTGMKSSDDYQAIVTVVTPTATRKDTTSFKILPKANEIKELASAVDIHLPYMNMGLHVTRYFRHDPHFHSYKGVLGYGWNHTFNVALTENTNGTVSFFSGRGFDRFYSSNADGTYEAFPGNVTDLYRDSDGTFQVVMKNGDLWKFNSDLQCDYFQNARGDKITYTYEDGKIKTLTDGAGQVLTFNYTNDLLSSVTDSQGRTVFYLYSAVDELVKVIDINNSVTEYLYDDEHKLVEIVHSDKRHQYFTYDEDNSLIKISGDGFADDVEVVKTDSVNIKVVKDPLGNETTIISDSLGRPGEVISAENDTIKYTYNKNNLVVSVVDGNNKSWDIKRDLKGNPTELIDPAGDTVKIEYSPNFKNLTKLIDANGNITHFEFNEKDELTKTIYPDGSEEINFYDTVSGNRRIQKKQRNGDVITFDFDSKGLLVKKTFPDNSEWNYTYDSKGAISSASNENVIITFETDVKSRITKVTYPNDRVFTYGYDSKDRRTQMVDPDGKVIDYVYNTIGELAAIVENKTDTVVKYEYNEAKRITKKILNNSTFTAYSYDKEHRFKRIENFKSDGSTISFWEYTYDKTGNILSKTGNDGVETYTYDEKYQLTAVTYPDGSTETFEYDGMGNRIKTTKNSDERTFVTNTLNQYESAGEYSFAHDLNGNMITKDSAGVSTHYQYDYENRLVGVTLPDGKQINYSYDPLGRMYIREFDSKSETFFYDNDQVYERQSDNQSQKYLWGRNLDEAITVDNGSDRNYFYQDHLNSITEITDNSGTLKTSKRYSAYGEELSGNALSYELSYTGAFIDNQVLILNLRNRFYDMEMGRFFQVDPINMAGGANLYQYVQNNSVVFRDPFGLKKNNGLLTSIWQGAVVGGTLGFASGTVSGYWTVGLGPGAPAGYVTHVGLSTLGGALSGAFSNAVGYYMFGGGGCGCGTGGWEVGGGNCPTFIQLPPQYSTYIEEKWENNNETICKINVPADGCLLRCDIPIFGIAKGEDFKHYRVEYGQGTNPTEWVLIDSSSKAETYCNETVDDIKHMQGDIDIKGNLATWNTGLKNWEHLPWHPEEEEIDVNGIYTIRLVVEDKNGKTVEDRVTGEVGKVIAQCLSGTAESSDRKVTMHFPEQSITAPFRVYTILPFSETKDKTPELKNGQEYIGEVYRIREPGDKFTKDVILEFKLEKGTLKKSKAKYTSIYQFDNDKKQWVQLKTTFSNSYTSYKTTLHNLPETKAYYALIYDKTATQTLAEKKSVDKPTLKAKSESVLVENSFEKNFGTFKERDRYVGAKLLRNNTKTLDGSYCLELQNENFGGNFSATVMDQPFDVREYSYLNFDYAVGKDTKLNFYIKVNGRWYDLRFTGDYVDFKNRDVNIGNLGFVENVTRDETWQTASIDLYHLVSQKTKHTIVEEIVLADWHVSGYMKLEYGQNPRNAKLYLDKFKIVSGANRTKGNALWVDDFREDRNTNFLGGASGTYCNPGSQYLTASKQLNGKEKDYALAITYDMTRKDAYGGYWTSIKGHNVTSYSSLQCKVKNSNKDLNARIGIRDVNGAEFSVSLNDFVNSSNKEWQTISIPLYHLSQKVNLSVPDVLFFSVDNKSNSGKGVFVIDDISFAAKSIPLSISFKDKDGSLGTIIHNGAAVISTSSYKDLDLDRNVCRISYGGSIGKDYGVNGGFSYAIWEYPLYGIDARKFQSVRFRFKSENGTEKPNFYLNDGIMRYCLRSEKVQTIASEWSDVYVPISYFERKGIDISHLESLQLVFEWTHQSGTIYIDEVEFVETEKTAQDKE